MLAGEVATNTVLWGELHPVDYPDALQAAAPRNWLDRSRGELSYARYWAQTANPINCSGALARAVLQAAHARLAHRRVWALNEKRMVQWAELSRLNEVFGSIGTTQAELNNAIAAVTHACDEVEQETTA
jgi:hypothetical protein